MGSKDIVAALKTLKDNAMPLISRGDRSGTHIAELNLWQFAGIDIAAGHRPRLVHSTCGHSRRSPSLSWGVCTGDP